MTGNCIHQGFRRKVKGMSLVRSATYNFLEFSDTKYACPNTNSFHKHVQQTFDFGCEIRVPLLLLIYQHFLKWNLSNDLKSQTAY